MESMVIEAMVNQIMNPELYKELANQIASETSGTVYVAGMVVEK